MRESITQLKNPPSPINNRYRPITRTDLSDSVNVKMPIKERKIGHGQTSVLIHRTRQAELLAYDVEEEEEEGQRRRCCEWRSTGHTHTGSDVSSASSEEACLPCSPPRVGMWAGMLRQLCTRKKASLIGKGRLSLSSRSPSLHLNPICLEEGAIVTYWFPILSGHVSVSAPFVLIFS